MPTVFIATGLVVLASELTDIFHGIIYALSSVTSASSGYGPTQFYGGRYSGQYGFDLS